MVERLASAPVAQLLHRALQRADRVFAQSFGQYALTRSQFAVLNAVNQSGGGGTQSTLVEVTGIDRSSMADLIARLVKRGWLQRRRAEHDKRAYNVQLTAKGGAVFAAAEPLLDRQLTSCWHLCHRRNACDFLGLWKRSSLESRPTPGQLAAASRGVEQGHSSLAVGFFLSCPGSLQTTNQTPKYVVVTVGRSMRVHSRSPTGDRVARARIPGRKR